MLSTFVIVALQDSRKVLVFFWPTDCVSFDFFSRCWTRLAFSFFLTYNFFFFPRAVYIYIYILYSYAASHYLNMFGWITWITSFKNILLLTSSYVSNPIYNICNKKKKKTVQININKTHSNKRSNKTPKMTSEMVESPWDNMKHFTNKP